MPNQNWLEHLWRDILNYKLPSPTFSAELLDEFREGVKYFDLIKSDWSSEGIEAVFQDKRDKQLYRVTIEHTKGEENGKRT